MKNETYEEFVEKFKPKKTTDDCYTPPEVYEVIERWVCRRYGIAPEKVIRPFWPGGDYENEEYPDGCAVIDNPPFSILTPICEFYLARKIPFFLFAPSLTCFSGKETFRRMSHVICDCSIEYANGAIVKTSFVTSYEPEVAAQTSPELTRLVNEVVKELRAKRVRELPKYEYPDYIVTAAMMQKYARYGVEFRVMQDSCRRVPALDEQRKAGKGIFGSGLLLSESQAAEKAAAEKAAAEKAAAEKAAVERYQLTAREMEMVKQLGQQERKSRYPRSK